MNRYATDREELLRLILKDGILYRSETQPVLSRDGTSARWMLDTLSVSMSGRGAELAGRCLLKLLQNFDGRQIATYGMTGVPLMQSVILQSGGRYHGLIVRKETKSHGSCKRIEGQIDPNEPTILLDDSVSSGRSMREGTEFLEQAGLRVEGGLALVRFGWDGGFARMRERGYHMEAGVRRLGRSDRKHGRRNEAQSQSDSLGSRVSLGQPASARRFAPDLSRSIGDRKHIRKWSASAPSTNAGRRIRFTRWCVG